MNKSIEKVQYHKKFKKQLQKSSEDIKRAFRHRLGLLIADQFHPLLQNHLLTGNYQGYRSINITGDWRALYKERIVDNDPIIIEFHLPEHIVSCIDNHDYLHI